MTDTIVVPDRLPVLPLPYPLVLHPSLLLSIPLSYAHSLSLLKAALQLTHSDRSSSGSNSGAGNGGKTVDAHKPIIVACVPTLRAPSSPSPNQGARDVARRKHITVHNESEGDDNDRDGAKVRKEEEDLRVRINDLFDWGCAARLVRLTRHPASQTCTLVVTGLTRVRVDRWLSVRAPLTSTALDSARNLTVPDVPVPLAAVTPFADGAVRHNADDVAQLRRAAQDVIEALALSSPSTSAAAVNKTQQQPPPAADPTASTLALPLLPAALLKRLRTFVADASDGQAGLLADVLVGTLGGSCEWGDRVAVLGDWDAKERVRNAAKVLSNGAARVRQARELLTSLSAPLNNASKESLARNQLEALLAQLAALNPNISARISTGNTSFSIGTAKGSGGNNDGGNGNNVNGIITIRSPNNVRNDDASNNPNGPRPLSAPRRNGNNPFAPPGSRVGGGAGGGAGNNEQDEEQDEVAELSRKLQAAQLSDEARKVCDRELKRLQRIPAQSVERGVVITYLETMAELPWDKTSADLDELAAETRAVATTTKDVAVVENDDEEGIVGRARRILDEDHYGLDKIKKRLVEYLAVLELKTEQAKERLEHEERQAKEAAGQAKRSAASANQRGKVEAAKKQQQQQIDLEGDSASDDSQIGHLEERGQDEESDSNKRKAAEERRKGKKRAAVADKGPILLLVGPPGTGKTSIARSLASALRRPFTRLSLGGVRDESEIRGHRRTYVGAMPGSIASSLRKVGVSDPVMLLDEVDKLGSGNGLHGDPMAAMLEVLDPEQNFQFMDHYVNCPIDLSRVLFIATANTLETISPPLLDRTEVIHVSGYTHDEKVAIAKQYLLPKQAKAQGLRPNVDIKVDDDVLLKIAMSYTREAGVRSLEREIGAVARGKAVQFSEARKGQLKDKKTGSKIEYDPNVRLEHLEDLLGVETFDPEVAEREARPGVATGLAYQGSGSGGILHIESLLLPPGNSSLKLTGKLGDVIRESAELSLSWVKAHSFQLGIVSERSSEFPKHDIHLHLPGGAIPKDGPSAGMAMTLALVSLFTRIPIDTKLAMTGEMTLRGQVTPVGGIKEKCLGAHRAGIRRLILPLRNRKDVEADLPKQIRDELNISYVRTIWQAIEIAFGQRALLESALKGGTGNLEGIEEGRRMMELEEARL
ncbi:ATP-dependent protease La [Acaromyces ingoldii]|uniref:Lon protease homolog n=1 Tax=Acaromyces ingoldii TaxID=215250 RepID=A0A316YGM7_9BASI|nr:ATP-dependent protease La [Acaromyces ingoldii]PWN87758.1 ATP-dependent protease La [Acaromyces ingoldii]